MNPNLALIICAFLWGTSTFLNRVSVSKMTPMFMQVIVGFVYILYMPIAIKMMGGISNIKLSAQSIMLTTLATVLSIGANVLMYHTLKNTQASSAMLVSLYPIVVILLSIIFLGESLTIGKVIGISTMVLGACILTFTKN